MRTTAKGRKVAALKKPQEKVRARSKVTKRNYRVLKAVRWGLGVREGE